MIKIRFPTKRGDQAVSLELAKGTDVVRQEMRKGNLVAINRDNERTIIQTHNEIEDGDEVLVFPRISGGIPISH